MEPNRKKSARLRRARRARMKIRELGQYRLSVHRTPRHTYAQVIEPDGSRVVAAASTLEQDVRARIDSEQGKIGAAKLVGEVVAERARKAGIERVAFDRSGFLYHGRVKALADGARDGGLQF